MFCRFLMVRTVFGSLVLAGPQAVAASGGSGLTLTEALARTAERHPRLLVETHSARAAGARVEQAGLPPDPTLDVSLENFAGSGALGGLDSAEATVRATQVIERGGKRDHRVTFATRGLEQAEASYAVSLVRARAATATAYIDVLAARQRLALSQELLALAGESAADASVRVESGVAGATEVARTRVAVALAKAAVTRDQAVFDNAQAALVAQWGGTVDDIGDVTGDLALPGELPETATLLAGLAEHPLIIWQHALAASQRAGLRLEQSRAVPDVSVGAGVRFFNDGRDAALIAAFSMPIPVRNRNQGNISAARAELAGADQSVRATELELRAAFTLAWQELLAARAAAGSLRDDALPAALDAHGLLHDAYERGEAALIDVLDARRELAAIRRQLLDAEASAAGAIVRIDALTSTTFPLTKRLFSSR